MTEESKTTDNTADEEVQDFQYSVTHQAHNIAVSNGVGRW